MAVRVVEVVLPNQAVALVRAADLDEGGQVAEKVGWKDTFDFADVSGTLEGDRASGPFRAGEGRAVEDDGGAGDSSWRSRTGS